MKKGVERMLLWIVKVYIYMVIKIVGGLRMEVKKRVYIIDLLYYV